MGRAVAGVDGCKGGWVAVLRTGGRLTATVHRRFEHIVDQLPDDAVIAVDMPIGLPERVGKGGRGPEGAVRPLLGGRQSSVFSIPSRTALYAATEAFETAELWYAAHRRASAAARETSSPPRGVSIQAFGLFPKIREIDSLLRMRPALLSIIHESHPEVAFCRLNGGVAMGLPKKVKSVVNPAGMGERQALLSAQGCERAFLERPPPWGAGADDVLDATAMLMMAERIAQGIARPFPDPPLRDALGIPIAIWA